MFKRGIIKVTECSYNAVETDFSNNPIYRRYSDGTWENLMGDSWEPVYDEAKMEGLWNDFFMGTVLSDNDGRV